ncbi:chemotaxis protein CheD [Amantichitinum ursilacus]|uniref:Probable chemoreceptor glutamine deamidase CheD n=1 Tax=Amantichitinum ursilacus TaxID=857265 RepID=A0A0N1JTU1_9NEIS|nr:chemotaxis protein CheD [Amantichitinum ursilacus]KPC55104.1 Chemoreceptor glutamine deamidase CheD [Amantichitinum ursilacus]
MHSIFVMPGEIWFGPAPGRIHTLLGSCLAMTVWHPGQRVGGLCHFLLPTSGRARQPGQLLNPRYGDDAMDALLSYMQDARLPAREFEYKLFGGGSFMSLPRRNNTPVGVKNIAGARGWLQRQGLSATVEDVGGEESRRIVLDLDTGAVWVHYAGIAPPAPTMMND